MGAGFGRALVGQLNLKDTKVVALEKVETLPVSAVMKFVIAQAKAARMACEDAYTHPHAGIAARDAGRR